MIADRKTAAERQYESFLLAVREFECRSNEVQFERTLFRLVAAHWETRRTDLQPESGSDRDDDAYRNSPPLNNRMELEHGTVSNPRQLFD